MTRSDDPISRLALGTAQMGLGYGVANRTGRPDLGAIFEILAHAKSAGIHTLDTSSAYGGIDTVLGYTDMSDWDVILKLPTLTGLEPEEAAAAVRALCLGSIERLGRLYVEAVLVDSVDDLDGPTRDAVLDVLGELMVGARFGWDWRFALQQRGPGAAAKVV